MVAVTDRKPIAYDDITKTGETATTMTFTIAANTLDETVKWVPVLLHFSFEAIFTALNANWEKFYVKDGATNLDVYVEIWDGTAQLARVWAVVPEITTSAKDLTAEFDPLATDNAQTELLEVIAL